MCVGGGGRARQESTWTHCLALERTRWGTLALPSTRAPLTPVLGCEHTKILIRGNACVFTHDTLAAQAKFLRGLPVWAATVPMG